MSDLLEVAVAAHGGLERWNSVTSIDVAASITGAIWFIKGKGDALKNVRFEVDTKRELVTMDVVGHDKRSIFEPSRVVIQRVDSTLIDERDDPERSFDGHVYDTGSSSPPRGGCTPGRVTTSSFRSRCWSPSIWVTSPSAEQATRFPCGVNQRDDGGRRDQVNSNCRGQLGDP